MVDAGILREGDRVELIRGELLQMTPIGPRHQAAVNAGTRWLVRLAGDDAIVQPQGSTKLDQFSAPDDTTVKAELYAIMGVFEYRTKREFHPGDSIAPQLLPSCRLDAGVLLPQ
jgi:hypothetical protein